MEEESSNHWHAADSTQHVVIGGAGSVAVGVEAIALQFLPRIPRRKASF
jgi:hypothetical protein